MEEVSNSESNIPLEAPKTKDFAVPIGPAPKKENSASKDFAVPSLPSRPKKVEQPTKPKVETENEPEVVKPGEIAGYGLTVIEKV